MSDQVKKSQTGKVKNSNPSGMRRAFHWIAWILVSILVILVIIAAALWGNRYSLVEGQVRKELAKYGIDADLDIEHGNRSEAVIKNLTLRHKGQQFFSARQLNLSYNFDDVRKGKFEKITVSNPKLKLNIDQSGNVTDAWLPDSSGDGSPDLLPKYGLIIKDGEVDWTAPWGEGVAVVDADVKSAAIWQAEIKIIEAALDNGTIAAMMDVDAVFDRTSENEIKIRGRFNTPTIRVQGSRSGAADAEFDIVVSSPEIPGNTNVTGNIKTSVAALVLPAFSAERIEGDFDISTGYDTVNSTLINFESDWDLNGKGMALNDSGLRSNLIQKTMSYNALSKTPIALHFADYFAIIADQFLQNFSFDGAGKYSHDLQGYQVELNDGVQLSSDKQSLLLRPSGDEGPQIDYQSGNNLLTARMDIDWLNERTLHFDDLFLQGLSENGLSLSGVDQVTTRIRSDKTWHTKADGQAIRLGKFDYDLIYNRNGESGQLNLKGAVDYDGLLPGGYAKDLQASGGIRMDLKGDNFSLAYLPREQVTLSAFTSDTGWLAENVVMTVSGADRVLRKRGKTRPLLVDLQNVTTSLTSPERDRHLDVQLDEIRLRTDLEQATKQWQMDILGTEITSEDFPAPGTHILANTNTVTVWQYPDKGLEFEIASPETSVETDNAKIENLSIDLKGSPDDFTAEYTAGTVEFKGGAVPVLPMSGTARLKSGELVGEAVANMPFSENTPIYIEYTSQDGLGAAHISIPKISFSPSGLQPQYLIPALRGKLAEVTGEASADFNFNFGGGGPITSTGTTRLINLDVGTLVGPITGVNTELTFKSMFPLETNGLQTATLAGFDPGFPLLNGDISFELVPEGVRIHKALWPVTEELGGGRIDITPMLWRFGNVENNAVVNIDNVSLGTLVAGIGNENISATGQISGVLPVSINGVDVEVNGGVATVKDGGVIRVKLPGSGAEETDPNNLKSEYWTKALENFEYKELEAKIDGPLDGEMSVRMAFEGQNENVIAGAVLAYNIVIEGELANIVRDTKGSFDANAYVKALVTDEGETSNSGQE
jgi:hypothetical protein